MKKVLLTFLILFITVASINAAKSTGEPRAFVQPDGTTLMVRLLGDEHFSWYQTMDGVLLKRAGKAFYIAKTMSDGTLANTGIIAHNLDNRKNVESVAAKAQNKSLFFAERNDTDAKAKAMKKSIDGYPQKYFCPHKGEVRIPIIMMEFAKTDSDEVKFTFGKEVFEEYFNGTEKSAYSSKTRFQGYSSVSQYFRDASYGELNMVFDLYGPYTTDKGHDYYGHHDGDGYTGPHNSFDLLKEAYTKADADIDFSKYDSDNDGRVDMVYVLYAGTGTNISHNENDFWPSCYYTSNSYATKDGKNINVIGGANEIAQYNVTIDGETKNLRAGIGVTCHEMSHGMGLPDLYWTLRSTPYDDEGYVDYNNCGPEDWDLMDGGENLYNAMWPCQYAAWERDVMGWITTEELTEPSDVTIYPLNKDGGKAYRVTNPNNAREYYIIENYMDDEWNYYVTNKRYGSGLMISHINVPDNGFSMSPNTIYAKPNITILPADGFILASYSEGEKIQYKGEIVQMPNNKDADGNVTYNYLNKYFIPDAQGDPYVGSKYTGDPITSVAAYKNYTGEDMVGKYPITDITRNSNGSISFKFMGGTASGIANINIDHSDPKAPIYSTDGRFVGTNRNTLPHGIYIQNGHKFLK